jgi:serine/threonine protein kinase
MAQSGPWAASGRPFADGTDVVRLVRHYCCAQDTAAYGPYRAAGADDAEPQVECLLPGRLYASRLVSGEGRPRPVDVQTFIGLSELGGLLWEQEVRALTRVTGFRHPALPQLLGGGYEDADSVKEVGVVGIDGCAFVITEGAEEMLGSEGAAYYRERPREALRQFALLADGLATLHDLGMAHRNLWPAAIDVVPQSDQALEPFNLRLARFELSAFITHLFSGVTMDTAAAQDEMRALVLGQGPGPLAYLPPERLAFLLPLDQEKLAEQGSKTDVFCLGAIVWEWFVGPVSAELLPTEVPGDDAGVRALRDRLEATAAERLRLLDSADLPEQLRGLLRAMLNKDQHRRPTATEVVNDLSRARDANLAFFGDEISEKPYLLAFMPGYSKATLYSETIQENRRSWLERDPTTEDGARELAERLGRDLRRGFMLYSPHGAEPFVSTGLATARREATTVLVGDDILWFCQPFRRQLSVFEGGGLGPPVNEALLIKYVAARSRPDVRRLLDDLVKVSAQRPLPELRPVDYKTERRTMDALLRDHPPWTPLLEAIKPLAEDSPAELDYQKAIDWLLEYQGVELRARQYAFKRAPDARPYDQDVLVVWDPGPDDDRIYQSALLTKYALSRPGLGDFFREFENDDGSADVEILPGEHPWPARGQTTIEAQLVRTAGQDRIVLRSKGEHLVPNQGWLRPLDDRGTEVALRRQADARWELFAMKTLTADLRDPRGIRTLPHRWADAGKGMLGDGSAAVKEMLSWQPFFALQGPPGTGKTTVASRAVAEYLKQESTHRILVASQSNFTLDNLAARILRDIGALDDNGPTDRLKDVPIALRVMSRRAEPDSQIRLWSRNELTVRRAGQMRAHIERILAGVVDEALRPVLRDWQQLLDRSTQVSVLPELADRLQRGANIVFATCSTATPRALDIEGDVAAFDWVIVEEAAKAWPTELAIPLVRGTRWTLIGDHHQLPAYRRDEVVSFLDSCIGDPSNEVAVAEGVRAAYINAFDLFRTLFMPRPDDPPKLRRPIAMLSTQFRMRPAIASIVSRVFYPRDPRPGEHKPSDGLPLGAIETLHDDESAPLRRPDWLAGPDAPALVWLDTGGLSICKSEPHWRNDGEAEVVNTLVESLQPRPQPNKNGFSAEPLAVLTPYRQQLEALRRRRALADYPLATMHAFQGREADIVIVSLVRDSARAPRPGEERKPWDGFGHLSRRDLVNVLFSRARRLLVLVGDFDHYNSYSDDEDSFWRLVCRGVKLYGERRYADEEFPGLETP